MRGLPAVSSQKCNRLSAGCLDHILELQEGLVRCFRIRLGHLGHHVWSYILAKVELGESIVHVHGLRCACRGHHVADGCVGGCVVSQGCHTLAINVLDCLAVGQDSCLESGWIHGSSHDQHLVDGLQHLQRTLGGQLGVHIRGPVNFLDEGVRSLRELLGRIVDLVCKDRCSTKHGGSSCSHRCCPNRQVQAQKSAAQACTQQELQHLPASSCLT